MTVREAVAGLYALVPHWATDLTIGRHTHTARTETVAQKLSFQGCIARLGSMRAYAGSLAAFLEQHLDIYTVVADGNKSITLGHRLGRIKAHRCATTGHDLFDVARLQEPSRLTSGRQMGPLNHRQGQRGTPLPRNQRSSA